MFIPMQFAMQNSDWRRILLSDSTPPKVDLFTLLCTIYCLNYFAKMLSGPQSYMESNSALIDKYSFQCNMQCRIQTGVEFCWVTQHLQKQICSTLLCTIYCLNYFAKMLRGPQSYIKSNSASYWYSFQCNLQCRIQTGVEFCWVTQHLQM